MLLTLIICQSCFYWHKKSYHSRYGYGLSREQVLSFSNVLENLERERDQ